MKPIKPYSEELEFIDTIREFGEASLVGPNPTYMKQRLRKVLKHLGIAPLVGISTELTCIIGWLKAKHNKTRLTEEILTEAKKNNIYWTRGTLVSLDKSKEEISYALKHTNLSKNKPITTTILKEWLGKGVISKSKFDELMKGGDK